jgi:LmbE family N-acetylglucosaminyl deacetylase
MTSKTVLFFAPHPDDAEFYAGGTLAKLISEGASLTIVTVTDGNKGSYEHDSSTLVSLRRQEACDAAAVLGANPPILLGHVDFELDRLPVGFLRQQFVRLIRQYRPDVVFAEEAYSSAEIHPDHRIVAQAAAEALNYSSLPLLYPEHLDEGLQPHFVTEKYFYSNDSSTANKIIEITDFFERKMAALATHKTQMDFLVEDIFLQARQAGLDLKAILGDSAADPLAAMTWAMQTEAAQIGQKGGVALGEAFRYVRYHPYVEALLSTQP